MLYRKKCPLKLLLAVSGRYVRSAIFYESKAWRLNESKLGILLWAGYPW